MRRDFARPAARDVVGSAPQPAGRRFGPAEQIALKDIALTAEEEFCLRLGLDALGDGGETEMPCHRQNGLGKGCIAGVAGQVTDEPAIDLDLGDRQGLQIAQAGIAGAEIIDREANAAGGQGVQDRSCFVDAVDQKIFGDLDHQVVRIGAGFGQGGKDVIDEGRIVQLPRADVDGHPQFLATQHFPGDDAAHRPDHPATHCQNRAGRLGDRDEGARWHDDPIGTAQADQRLGADHRAGTVDLGLQPDFETVMIDRIAQCAFDHMAPRNPVLHRGFEKHQRCIAGRLGLLHGDVGLAEQILDRACPMREDRDPDVGANMAFMRGDHDRRCERVEQFGRDLLGDRGCSVRLVSQIGEQNGEFVTREPRDDVGAAQSRAKPARGLGEHEIADVMAMQIVDDVEAAEIDEQQRPAQPAILRMNQRTREVTLQHGAVGHAGQLIEEREPVDLLIGFLLVADIDPGADDPFRLRRGAREQDFFVAHPTIDAAGAGKSILVNDAPAIGQIALGRKGIGAIVGMDMIDPPPGAQRGNLSVAEQALDVGADLDEVPPQRIAVVGRALERVNHRRAGVEQAGQTLFAVALRGYGGIPGGAGPQKPATAMPAPIALAATWDPELARTYGKLEAEEARSLGSQLLESPDVNIARVPQGGRVFESFGEDPYLDGRIAVADIEGIQSTGMFANVKHYVANNQESARHTVNEVVGERALREIYLPAFEAAVKEAHVASVMCAYPKVNSAYNCENAPQLNGVLKKQWGFDGFVVSDWGATQSTVASALAGLDLEMPTGRFFNGKLKEAVQSGQVPAATIDEMLVRRFAKEIEFGLFGTQSEVVPIPAFEHGRVARTIAEQSMVLLKNEGSVLPLDFSTVRSIVLIGPYAVRPSTGGGGSSHVIPLYTITPDDGMFAAIDWQRTRLSVEDGSDVQAAVDAAKRAGVAIVMVGDQDTEGRDQSLELPAAQNELIEAVAKANPKTVVVVKSGSAVLMPWIDHVSAVLEAWYPGEEDGHAVADVLTGKVNPSGKLPITFPRSVEDTLASNAEQYPGVNGVVHYSEELDVGYRAYAAHHLSPLFPFGFGLSYTDFSFDALKVRKGPGAASAIVSFKVTNTGKRAGTEVPQVYLGFPPIAEGNEPPLQLKEFRKVMLNPGESKTVELKLDACAFSYWSVEAHAWQVAEGEFQVMVGNSSANTPLHATLVIR